MIDPATYVALNQLILSFWRRVETEDYDGAVSLLARAPKWLRGGRMRTGREDIRAALDERPTGRTVRHLITNLTAEPDGDEYVCTYLISSLSADASEGEPPFAPRNLGVVAESRDRFCREDGALRFKELGSRILFMGGH